MTTILWFKRDLRVQDNPALVLAAPGPVIPLYIVEPQMWAAPDASARQFRFVSESLRFLSQDLAALGAPLVLRFGEACAVLEALRRAHGVLDLVSHEETGVGWSYERDRRVGSWARAQGVRWREVGQGGVVRRLGGRDGWARARERFVRAPALAPVALHGPNAPSDPLPEARELGLAWDPCAGRQRGGRAEGLAQLDSFLTHRGRLYRSAMSSPLEGAQACSRISPHLAWGTLSVRETAQACQARTGENDDSIWAKSLKSFQSRLAWRDHFMQKLEDAPDLDRRCLHSAYEGLRPRGGAHLAAWEAGETGLPFLDACLRSLRATGWLNFRMRAMVSAVASYHLWLDWRETGPHLARMFTDYEPGIHWSQMQMQSGTTGINTLRVYNPIKQGRDQDPTGTFTRKWVPELAAVPDGFLQEPWAWGGAKTPLGRTYPLPIVDFERAARQARARVWAVRQGAGYFAEAEGIVRKHASRKGGSGGFQRDPMARRPASNQLSFDL